MSTSECEFCKIGIMADRPPCTKWRKEAVCAPLASFFTSVAIPFLQSRM